MESYPGNGKETELFCSWGNTKEKLAIGLHRYPGEHRDYGQLMWAFPRPQHWFTSILNSRAQEDEWRRHFRIQKTFANICQRVGPVIARKIPECEMSLRHLPSNHAFPNLGRESWKEVYRTCWSHKLRKSAGICDLPMRGFDQHGGWDIGFSITHVIGWQTKS